MRGKIIEKIKDFLRKRIIEENRYDFQVVEVVKYVGAPRSTVVDALMDLVKQGIIVYVGHLRRGTYIIIGKHKLFEK